MEPWTDEHFEQILSARLRIVDREDARQAFLHELELETHRDFLKLNPRLTAPEKLERTRLVRRTCECLIRRVDARLSGDRSIEIPPPDDIARLCRIFDDAIAALAGKWTLGETLLDFARGALGRTVYFTHENARRPYRVSEPDSGFLFLFAEWGFAANACGQSRWTPPLLLDLIRMQRYFLERNAHQRPRPWLQYRQPQRPLTLEAQARIDAEYSAFTETPLSVPRLEALMVANLRFATIGRRRRPIEQTEDTVIESEA
ncbi:MAG TPA: hypothetical protein P5081_02695 [Phycisphaerae bacterium]|nr:hypothetical protein [Phycisphaerae bacterium]HRW51766.1 hypothetical protein [Phycisphaerae bacterium]